MSHFNCPTCDAPHIDTEGGYVSGCLCESTYQKKCDVCGRALTLINPDGWLRCLPCWEQIEEAAKEET